MEKGTKIELSKLGERDFDTQALIEQMRRGAFVTVSSWGSHAWRFDPEQMWFRFKVNGHHHKGHVYISLAFNDTFTIHYTTVGGIIKDIQKDVYIDELIESIDKKVEWIEEYK